METVFSLMEYDTMRPSLQDLVLHSLSELVAKLLLVSEVMSDLDFWGYFEIQEAVFRYLLTLCFRNSLGLTSIVLPRFRLWGRGSEAL